jgi:hypothetical protein
LPVDAEDFVRIELAFLNKPPNLWEESFCAETEKDKKRKEVMVIIFFIGIIFYLQK